MGIKQPQKIKIPKKFLFTSSQLNNYLKTVGKFGKLEEEILATITYKSAYCKLHSKDVLISFPYKVNKEIEINKRPMLLAKDIGKFIKENAEENSLIDSILVDPQNDRYSMVTPLQIKFVGKGKYSNLTTQKLIEFLQKKSGFDQSNFSLILVLEPPGDVNLFEVCKWLSQNKFPFAEVVLISSEKLDGDMYFYQVKPSKNNIPMMLTLKKEELWK